MSSAEASAYTTAHPELLEAHDGQLVSAREYLALLEADPETDELTIVVARNAVLQRKLTLVKAIVGES